VTVRVQREPFEAKGARAESFAPGTRFAKQRLWHVEMSLAAPVPGPFILGDGRYLGLGIMAPVKEAWRDVMVFSLPADARVAVADGVDLLRAVRRALMALSRDDRGNVPPLFSGHEPNSAPARSGQHKHVFFASADVDGDGITDRLIVAAPWACDRSFRGQRLDRARFDRIVSSLEAVRAGKLGVIKLDPPAEPGPGHELIGPATVWKSHTPYRPTRHAGRRKDLALAVSEDVIAECGRRGLPRPQIELLGLTAGPNGGDIAADVRLRFSVAVRGPILLGRDSHFGGGLFGVEMTDGDVGLMSATTSVPSSS
jgi:CRISPR-associated protein Csb2